jgi:hypothetical protein
MYGPPIYPPSGVIFGGTILVMTQLPRSDYESRFLCQVCGVTVVPFGERTDWWEHDGENVEFPPHEAVPDPRLLADMERLDELQEMLNEAARAFFIAGYKDMDWHLSCGHAWTEAEP